MFFSHKCTRRMRKRLACLLLTLTLAGGILYSQPMTVYATLDDLAAEAEDRKSLPIQSNEIDNWPAGPQIGAQAAIVMDVNTGVILYAKNIHEKLYPASTTKILTCLIAMEQGNLDDMVEFSSDAVFSVPAGGSNMGMDVGQSITLEQCLYGILVGSANEVANAVGEHIAGSIDNFVSLMNKRAKELGCTDSHFLNTNGLQDDNHYTSAYDLAKISCAFFQNEMLAKIGNTARYHFEPTATQPDDFYLNNKHQLITGEIPYDGILGGKTGYTDKARQTLVTCAEQNGMKLVCVVFKEESPYQFTDTEELFDYAFHNFQVMNISENEDKYNMESTGFLQTGNDIFGSSKPILSVDPDGYVIVPNTTTFDDLDSTIIYGSDDGEHIAQIEYTYHNTYIGSAYIELASNEESVYDFDRSMTTDTDTTSQTDPSDNETIFINVKAVLIGILIFATVVILIFIIKALLFHKQKSRRRNNRLKRRKYRKDRIRSKFGDFDF